MTGLRKPPQAVRSSRVLARFLVLVLLLAVVGLAVWAAVTERRIAVVETTPLDSTERAETIEIDGVSLNLEQGPGGPIPVVLLHDFDIAGSALLEEVAAEIDPRGIFHPLRIDLPGFGLSSRLPEPGEGHTIASMAEVVATVVRSRYDFAVVVAGVGMGGEVAAEMAVASPELVRGVVMVDTDFWDDRGWLGLAEMLPYVSRSVVHTFEAGGLLGVDMWAPECDRGGWCPTADQLEARRVAASVEGTTDSLVAFVDTPESSLVPSDLGSIGVPVAYVWSTAGEVPRETVDMIRARLPEMTLITAGVWKAHLEAPGSVIEAINQVGR